MKRRIYQVVSLLVLHSWFLPQAKWLCNPVLSCHSCALTWLACPVGVFVNYSSYQIFPFIAVGTVLLVGALLGRLLCGWICPFGLVQDLLYRIRGRKIELPRWANHIKYGVLVLFVVLLPWFFGEDSWGSFCRYCPAAALQVRLPGFIASRFEVTGATVVKFVVLGVVIFGAIVASRSFCRVLCPIGALLAPLNYVSFWVVRPTGNECITCQACDKACITEIAPSARLVEDIPANRALDCVVCHECTAACRKVEDACVRAAAKAG